MIMTIDRLATRYGHLPSNILSKASTFDLFIMDAAMHYEHHLQQETNPSTPKNYSQEELMEILESSRG